MSLSSTLPASCVSASCSASVGRSSCSTGTTTRGLFLAKRSLSEDVNQGCIVMLLELAVEFACDVHQMSRFHKGASVQLALAIDVSALNKLLIKHHDQLLLSLADYRASCTKRHISPLHRAHVQHSVTDLEFIGRVLGEEA